MKWRLGVGVALLAGVVAVASIDLSLAVQRWDELGPVPPGEPMPALSFATLEGEALDTAALRGRVTVLTFWTTWCPACRSELADVDALAREFEGEDVAFVAVNLEGGQMPLPRARELVANYRDEHALTVPLAIDGGAAARALRIGPIPHTVVLDAAGAIRRVHQGRVLSRTLRADIERLQTTAATDSR